ncbi:MAG TPA: ABC transporter substrate-binding protein, partial [Terriglobales bacterium]|nr:ABC transporter substrate-binding protein [Terriglobales bacterium]
MNRRISALALGLLLLLSGCKRVVETIGAPQSPAEQPGRQAVAAITLPYDENAGLDPLTTTSRYNLELGALLYRPLVGLASGMEPSGGLAESVEVSGNVVTLRLSSPVAAQVADILNRIRTGATNFSARLGSVTDIAVAGDSTLVVTLTAPDAGFPAMLNIPMSCAPGLYTLSEGRLVANGEAALREIGLLSIHSDEEAAYAYRSGGVTVVTGMTGLQGKQYATNNLVFLGTTLKNAALRKAISAAINRTELIDDNLSISGYVALSPVHPDWYLYDPYAVLHGFDAGYAKEQLGGATPKLRLLVCSDSSEKLTIAQSIAFQLKSVGIETEITEVDKAAYLSALERRDFDLYLGEVRLTPDMDLTPLCGTGGALNYGGLSIASVDDALAAFKAQGGRELAKALMETLDAECP